MVSLSPTLPIKKTNQLSTAIPEPLLNVTVIGKMDRWKPNPLDFREIRTADEP